ncbi:MAG: ArnT family glycosyltransferase, partial [Aquificaceae bacterium]
MLYFLLLFIPFLYFINLGLPQVWIPNESFYADASRHMLESFDFLTPYYNGQLRLAKPPMTYWIVSLGYAIFGINELGLRFFHALLGLLVGLLTFLLSKEVLKDTKTSLFSMLILLTSFQFFANARYASPEVPFVFFITLSLYLWLLGYKRGNTLLIFLAFLSSSLAMLVKGPAGFFIPASVVFLYLILNNP